VPALPRADGSVIARLRLRGATTDPLAARLRLEALLGAVDPPRSLPAGAILCVRRVDDPLPGALPLAGHALRPPARWERALAESLDASNRRASRPARGPVPAGAEAVVFGDLAELLACLARDLASGLAAARWWWRALYGGADLRRLLVDEWLGAPECVPPALDRLAREGLAAPLLAAIGEASARALVRAVAVRHGLAAVLAALEPGPAEEDVAAGARLDSRVPELAASPGGVEARTLLAVALLLRRAPAALRGEAFGPALSAWRRREASADEPERSLPGSRLADAAPGSLTIPAGDAPHAGSDDGVDAPAAGLLSRLAPERPAPLGAVLEARDAAAAPPRFAWPPGKGEEGQALCGTFPRSDSASAPVPSPLRALEAKETILTAAAEELAHPAPEARGALEPLPNGTEDEAPPEPLPLLAIDTELGGLFYLVNVGLSLGLYGDFTTPLAPGLALPVWDFVSLLGERLLGDQEPDDPVWALLARLAGRDPAEPPGAGFAPPAGWRLPPGWLEAGADDRAWDADGPGVGQESALGRWICWLAGHVHHRLLRALRLDDPAALAPLLLRRRARVHLADTRVDVHLALTELPLAVRLAGLDRDPGWLPAGGRALFFHFG